MGLGVIVLGTLQSSTWGWVKPKDSPITPFGFSLTIWMIAGGALLLWSFTVWQRHRETTGADPLVHLDLLRIPPLRAGLNGLFSQNLILMGVFFVVPLYLQLVLGLDALQTGIKMLPDLDHDVPGRRGRLAAVDPLHGARDRPGRASPPRCSRC